MRTKNDTIAAIATPAGVGGIAVVRLSGADALGIALRHLSVSDLAPRKATYCGFYTSGKGKAESGKWKVESIVFNSSNSLNSTNAITQSHNNAITLDDVVAVYFPKGYTGEPTVEISCHGSIYIQQTLLQTLLTDGARLAEPGEYTMRAFLHGRLDLSQAEAVADLIDAVTPAQHQLAVSQLRGGYADKLRQLRRQLLDLTSLLELELDFSQEDVEFADRDQLRQLLVTLEDQTASLIASFKTGNAIKSGIPVAIIGRPNAGKSSLLNALLHDDRAIVSPVPGTTRDTIEETMTIDGVTFRFIDTAGLRESSDDIEALGIERSINAARQARIILYVSDVTEQFGNEDHDDMAYITERCDMNGKQLYVVHNKCDLPHGNVPEGIVVSAKLGIGIEHLKQRLADTAKEETRQNDGVMLSNLRHYEALSRMQQALQNVQRGLDDGMPSDLVAVDLRDALYHLGSITGDVANNEILSNIFSHFCIGK